MSVSSGYNVNMIATPPPAEPQYITVSAILFAPEEGEPPARSFPHSTEKALGRTSTDHLRQL